MEMERRDDDGDASSALLPFHGNGAPHANVDGGGGGDVGLSD